MDNTWYFYGLACMQGGYCMGINSYDSQNHGLCTGMQCSDFTCAGCYQLPAGGYGMKAEALKEVPCDGDICIPSQAVEDATPGALHADLTFTPDNSLVAPSSPGIFKYDANPPHKDWRYVRLFDVDILLSTRPTLRVGQHIQKPAGDPPEYKLKEKRGKRHHIIIPSDGNAKCYHVVTMT